MGEVDVTARDGTIGVFENFVLWQSDGEKRSSVVFEHSAVTGDRVWPGLIAFHRSGARGGAEVRRAARSPIAFDLSVCRKDVRRSREVVAGETRWSRRGAHSLSSLPLF